MDLTPLTWGVRECAERIRKNEIDPLELLDLYERWTTETEEKVGTFLSIQFDFARDRYRKGVPKGKLFGVPFAIKDNIHIEGFPTTCASRILKGYYPPYSATVIVRMMEEGALFFGKTNMDEFAMGSSTENSAYKITRNPWDFTRVPGGSSGGSACAVKALQTPGTLGSDTGGSIRQPSAFCGITGLKPTYGRVSRYGLVAFASSLDQIGPMGRSAEDCAYLMEIIAGEDPKDATSLPGGKFNIQKALSPSIRGKKLGLPREYYDEGLDEGIRKTLEEFLQFWKGEGGEIVELSLPHTPYTTAVYYILATAEASSNLARYDGVRYGYRKEGVDLKRMYEETRGEGFGKEVKRRILLGTFVLSTGYYSAYYGTAQKVRTLICRDFEKAFQEVDFLFTPTTPTLPFHLGEKISDPLTMYLSDIYTNGCNLAGIPGIAFPVGFLSNLPVGGQLMGPPFSDEDLLAVVYAYQRVTKHHLRLPSWIEERIKQ
jgi:aspartyl-tRNA(Asn)/glutamyl-tRNA(Gln) amidotransferase subunit A